MGTIYKRGETYWIKYYDGRGKPLYESSKSDKTMVAKKLLSQREGEIAEGRVPGIHFDKVKFDDLADDLLSDYKVNGRKSIVQVTASVAYLKVYFKGMKVREITTAKINDYIEKKLEEKFAPATINRQLSVLKRMFNLGAKANKVDRVPYTPILKERNVRKGFFENSSFLSLRDALPEHPKGVVTFGYRTGWRISEVVTLTWSRVDLKQGIVRLESGETKNEDARTIYLDDELKQVLESQKERRKKLGTALPWVFLNADGTDRVKRFYKAWKTTCKNATIGIKLFHDFRRTAVRSNMVRSGIPKRVAMMISGNKTRAVFERYNIVSDADLRLAAQRQHEYLQAQMVTKTVTIANAK